MIDNTYFPGACLVWCPFPDLSGAETAAATLLDERLIACANMVPGMRSLYRWQGERGAATEVGVLFKTHGSRLAAVLERLEQLHPYEQPAVLAWQCDAGSPATLAWIEGLGA